MACYYERKGTGKCHKTRCQYSHDPAVLGTSASKGKGKASKGRHKKGKKGK